MFVILSYDVCAKRCQKIMKICKKYLRVVHESVFEGEIGGSDYNKMKEELAKVVNQSEDSIRIYELNSVKYTGVSKIGIDKTYGPII